MRNTENGDCVLLSFFLFRKLTFGIVQSAKAKNMSMHVKKPKWN